MCLGLQRSNRYLCAFPSRDFAVFRLMHAIRLFLKPQYIRSSAGASWLSWMLVVHGEKAFLFVRGPRLGSCKLALNAASGARPVIRASGVAVRGDMHTCYSDMFFSDMLVSMTAASLNLLAVSIFAAAHLRHPTSLSHKLFGSPLCSISFHAYVCCTKS